MKTVFTNSMVAHVWAQQSQSHGRNGNHSFYFQDATICSYGHHFPIARFVGSPGNQAVLFTTRSHSITTSQHVGLARQAIPQGVQVFHVEHPDVTNHAEQMEGYTGRIAALMEKAMKARSNAIYYETTASATAAEARKYAEFFGLTWDIPEPILPVELRAKKLQQAADAEARSEAKWAARNVEAEARRIARNAKFAENLADWQAGAEVPGFYYTKGSAALLRVKGELVETSAGAEIPVSHALRIWPLIQRCKSTGTAYQRNGHAEHIGHFTLDSIDQDGNIRAGCHYIEFSELARIATVLGLS